MNLNELIDQNLVYLKDARWDVLTKMMDILKGEVEKDKTPKELVKRLDKWIKGLDKIDI